MKTQTMIPQFTARLAALSLFITTLAFADGIPEPGLVMYGAVRNSGNNARATVGSLTWTITSVIGARNSFRFNAVYSAVFAAGGSSVRRSGLKPAHLSRSPAHL